MDSDANNTKSQLNQSARTVAVAIATVITFSSGSSTYQPHIALLTFHILVSLMLVLTLIDTERGLTSRCANYTITLRPPS